MAEYDKVPLNGDPVAASVGPVDKTKKEETVVQAKAAVPTFWQKEATHAKAAVKKSWTQSVVPTIKSLVFQSISSLLSAVIFQDDATAMSMTKAAQNVGNTLRVNYGGMFNQTTTTQTQKPSSGPVYSDNVVLEVSSKEEADMLKEAIIGCIDKYTFASSRALYEMAGLQDLAKPIDENYGWKKDSISRITTRMVDGAWRISMPPRVAR